MTYTKPIDIILCRDLEYGIGLNNNLPWKINIDLKYFNNITTSTSQGISTDKLMNAVLMGNNTWKSLHSIPLKNRLNVVISTTHNVNSDNVVFFNDPNSALQYLNKSSHIETIYVIGGSTIYNHFFHLNNYRYLYETIILKIMNCDTFIHATTELPLKIIYHKTFSIPVNDEINKVTFVKHINMSNKSQYISNDNIEENLYLTILDDLIKNGDFRSTRNSNTWSLFDKSITFDISNKFPLLTTKKVNFKSIYEELIWFLRGSTNAKELNDKGINIWNGNSSREFLDSNGLSHYKEYDIGPMYGFNLRHFGYSYSGMNENYDGKGFDQIDYVINLLKNDPYSRRIVMTTFNPSIANQGVLYPCHGLITQFYVRNNKYLDLVSYQRSVDIFIGFPFNIASYALLSYMLCNVVNSDPNSKIQLSPGKLTIHLGDVHLYEEHYEQAITQILREPFIFPTLQIINNHNNIQDIIFDDIILTNYKHHIGIIAKMIA